MINKKVLLVVPVLVFLAASCSTTPPPDYSKQLDAISAQLAKSNEKPVQKSIDDELTGYQAVFLSNGQVYFGKLSDYNDRYLDLKDIYYLQTSSGLQGMSNSSESSSINLVKLGNELHSPQDEMFLDRGNVLFFENLKSDGQIAAAIQADKTSKK
jgi:hypothetical protein